MKKLSLLTILLGIVLFMNACGPDGYVAEQPVYVEGVRPMQPSPAHIWIEGNWNWNRQTRAYDHREGNWALPNRNKVYSTGQWKSNKNGHYWQRGSRQ